MADERSPLENLASVPRCLNVCSIKSTANRSRVQQSIRGEKGSLKEATTINLDERFLFEARFKMTRGKCTAAREKAHRSNGPRRSLSSCRQQILFPLSAASTRHVHAFATLLFAARAVRILDEDLY